MVRGKGNRVYDDAGREYLDAVGGGAAVANIGFAVPEVIDAVRRQVEILPFIHNQKFTNQLQEHLAEVLIEHAPDYSRVLFCQGGAEANETALRLVRSYHVERGETSRWRVISPAQAYHGSTTATLALTGRPALQHPYGPYLPGFLHTPPVDRRTDPDGREALRRLERLLAEAAPGTIAAYFCEPISAAACPAFRPPDSFYAGLAQLSRQHGFLVVFDEVVTGVGRTGAFFAADKLPIVPDVITTAKGLGGGYVPMGAVLAVERVYEAVAQGSKDFTHGHTFNGYPLGCAVALAVLEYIDRHDLIGIVARMGPRALEILREALEGCPLVEEVRGEGFLFGITYRDTTGGFLEPSLRVARRVDVAALAEGLLTYSTQPTADGYAGDQTMLAPAFTTTEEEFGEIGRRLRRAIERVARDVGTGATLATVRG
jgi:adenosylmethionine-8-amino-7-oxononanoate aminotransferase